MKNKSAIRPYDSVEEKKSGEVYRLPRGFKVFLLKGKKKKEHQIETVQVLSVNSHVVVSGHILNNCKTCNKKLEFNLPMKLNGKNFVETMAIE